MTKVTTMTLTLCLIAATAYGAINQSPEEQLVQYQIQQRARHTRQRPTSLGDLPPEILAKILINNINSSSPEAFVDSLQELATQRPTNKQFKNVIDNKIFSRLATLKKDFLNLALLAATSKGHVPVVSILLKVGADINTRDEDGRLPLHIAARDGHNTIVRMLLANGANGNAEVAYVDYDPLDPDEEIPEEKYNDVGNTPLHYAARNNHGDVLLTLLARPGINVNKINMLARTPLHDAARHGASKAVELLLSAATIDIDSAACGYTPLHDAMNAGNLKVAQELIRAGANPNVADFEGHSPLNYAYDIGNNDIAKWLIAYGAQLAESSEDYDWYLEQRAQVFDEDGTLKPELQEKIGKRKTTSDKPEEEPTAKRQKT